MARIIYGVQGSGHGHAMRALTIARHMKGHQFLFISSEDGLKLLRPEFPVADFYNIGTPVVRHKIDTVSTTLAFLRGQFGRRRLLDRIINIINGFRPDLAISDYEYFVPLAARQAGLPCLSLDHQHVITHCRHDIPLHQYSSFQATYWAARLFFSRPRDYLIVSFFQPPLRATASALICPPLLRARILEQPADDGEHVLAYHGYQPFPKFYSFFGTVPGPVKVYGANREFRDGNLEFKQNSEDGFIRDLASSRYVICGGGHTLLSEALYFGKPVLVFPIMTAFEQFLNAHYVARLGYGLYHESHHPSPELIDDMEYRLGEFKRRLSELPVQCGNERIFSTLEFYFQHGFLDVT